jgi:hypothetical protein
LTVAKGAELHNSLSLCNIPSDTEYSRDPSIERCSQAS